MAGARHTAPSAEARAGRQREARSRRDLCEGEGVELRRDLVRKPGAVVLLRVRPRPFPVTAVVFSVRLCPLRVGRSARTRVGNVERLRGESLARRCDRALGTGPARTRYARLAVAAPALQHGLAARCTRGRYECERFRARGVPRFARIRPWFRRLARRRTKRRRRGEREGVCASTAGRFASTTRQVRARRNDRCAAIEQRRAECVCEMRNDRRDEQPPARQRECEVVRERSAYAAYAVGEFYEFARGDRARFTRGRARTRPRPGVTNRVRRGELRGQWIEPERFLEKSRRSLHGCTDLRTDY